MFCLNINSELAIRNYKFYLKHRKVKVGVVAHPCRSRPPCAVWWAHGLLSYEAYSSLHRQNACKALGLTSFAHKAKVKQSPGPGAWRPKQKDFRLRPVWAAQWGPDRPRIVTDFPQTSKQTHKYKPLPFPRDPKELAVAKKDSLW